MSVHPCLIFFFLWLHLRLSLVFGFQQFDCGVSRHVDLFLVFILLHVF